MDKWIQIWYSWGDHESPIKVPKGTDAWEYMKQLVINEVDVSQDEYPYGCGVWMYPDENKIVLKYYYDNECCYYLITDTEEYTEIN